MVFRPRRQALAERGDGAAVAAYPPRAASLGGLREAISQDGPRCHQRAYRSKGYKKGVRQSIYSFMLF